MPFLTQRKMMPSIRFRMNRVAGNSMWCGRNPETTWLFYEVYDSREAFDDHLKTPHLDRFREAFPALIEEELPVRFLNRQWL